MRRLLRTFQTPRDDHAALLGDALGALALFVLAYAALHLPLMA